MASPQTENGHIKIANELWERWTLTRVNGEAEQVLKAILRKTYGFNKKSDEISLSQFVILTGLSKTSVIKAIRKLKVMNLITQKGQSRGTNFYSINKDYETWVPLPKRVIKEPKSKITMTQKGHLNDPKGDIQKTVLKDSIKRQYIADEINKLLGFFKEHINPHISFANKTERKACEDLIKTYGLERTKDAALFVHQKQQQDRYVPRVTSPYELYTKWAKLQLYFQKTKKTINLNNL